MLGPRMRIAPWLRAFGGASALGAAVALGTGCHGEGAARLQGTWRGVRTEGVAPDAVAGANAFALSTELDVKGDALTVITPKDTQSGRYRVVKQDRTTLVITTDKDGAEDPQTFVFVDDRTVRWAVLEGRSIVFARQ
jgi:hypothetical protein